MSRSARRARIAAQLASLAAVAVVHGGPAIPAAVAQPSVAVAPPGAMPEQRVDPPLSVRPSYRRQVMIADGVGAAAMVGATAAGAWLFAPDDFHLPLMIGGVGFTSYVLTAPIIHMAHGRVGRGLLSGTIRVVVPAIVAATAVSARGLEERDDGYDATFFAGMAAGVAGAIAIDWWLLVPDGAAAGSSAPRFTPVAAIAPRSGLLGVAGTW